MKPSGTRRTASVKFLEHGKIREVGYSMYWMCYVILNGLDYSIAGRDY